MLYEYRQFYNLHKNKNTCIDFAEDVETRFDTSNHELGRPLPRLQHKNNSWIKVR